MGGGGGEMRIEDGKRRGSSGKEERTVPVTMIVPQCSRSLLSSTEDIYKPL